MSLGTLILVLVVLGVVMYLINVYVPMEQKIKSLLNIGGTEDKRKLSRSNKFCPHEIVT